MPKRDATQGQIGFIANLLEQIPEDDQFAEDVREVLHDPTHMPTFAWATEMIDELKAHIADERYNANDQPADKGRLTASERLDETPSERIKRVYAVAWELRGMSADGFAKRWAEIGAETLAFHGVAA